MSQIARKDIVSLLFPRRKRDFKTKVLFVLGKKRQKHEFL